MKPNPLVLIITLLGAASAIDNGCAATITLEAVSARSQNGSFWTTSYFTGVESSVEWRSNFVFDLSSVTDQVVSAYLELEGYNFFSSVATETVAFFDAADYRFSPAQAPNFGDLGSGNQYGTMTISLLDANQLTLANLNSLAIADINTKLGGTFSVGGKLASLNGSSQGSFEGFFQGSSSSGVQRLVLTTVPEPSTAALIVSGFAFATSSVFRRRR